MLILKFAKALLITGIVLAIFWMFTFLVLPKFGYTTNVDIEISKMKSEVDSFLADEITIPGDIKDELNQLFEEKIPNEYFVCVDGVESLSGITITQVYSPKIITSEPQHLQVADCAPGAIGTIHSHVYGTKKLSPADIFSFGRYFHKFMCVQTAVGEFSCYKPYIFDKSMTINIMEG